MGGGDQSLADRFGITYKAVRELIGDRISAASDPVIFISGSVVEGFGTPSSDIDVYVVLQDGEPTNMEDFFLYRRIGGIPVDLECWTKLTISGLRQRIESVASQSGMQFTFDERCFVHSLRTGLPLSNDEGLRHLKASFNYSVYQENEVTVRLLDYEGILQDIEGSMQVADPVTALGGLRKATETLFQAYLHLRGDLNPREKWCYRRLLKLHHVNDDIVQSYLKYSFPVVLRNDEDANNRLLLEGLEWLNRFLLDIQLTSV